MGVYIKGMEMPQICFKCKLSRIIPSIYIFCPLNEKCYPADEMPSDCPLISVPPHGRLADVDKVLDELAHNLGLRSLDYLTPSERAIVSWFRDATTVIPAEPPKEKA